MRKPIDKKPVAIQPCNMRGGFEFLQAIVGFFSDGLMRVLHFAWRFSRGQAVDVRVLALDAAGAVLLVFSEDGWRLPGETIVPGESAPSAVRRALAAIGAREGHLALYRLYRVATEPHPDHIALYIAHGAACSVSPDAQAAFFAPDALPRDTEPASRRRIAAVLHGLPEDAIW